METKNKPENETANQIAAVTEIIGAAMLKYVPTFMRAMNEVDGEDRVARREDRRATKREEQETKLGSLECILANQDRLEAGVDWYLKITNKDDDEDEAPTLTRRQAVTQVVDLFVK